MKKEVLSKLIYLFSLCTTILNYVTRRGIGMLLPMFAKLLLVPASSLVFIQSFFGLSRSIVCLSSGPWFDKNPRLMLKFGIFLQFIGSMGIIFFTSFYLFITSIFILIMGYQVLNLSLWNILVRSKGYGRTYDVMWMSVGISLGPILMFFLAGILKTTTISSIFGIYILLLVLFAFTIIYLTGKVDVRPGIDTTYKLQYSNFFNLYIMRNVVILVASVSADITMIVFTVFMMSLGYTFLQSITHIIFIFALTSIVSRFFFSWVGYKYGTRMALMSGALVCGVGAIFCMVPTYMNIIIALVLLGFGTGSGSMNVFTFLADRYGRKNYFATYSIFAIYGGLFEGSMVWLAGFILSTTKDYQMIFLFLALFNFLCVIIQMTDKNVYYVDKINGVNDGLL